MTDATASKYPVPTCSMSKNQSVHQHKKNMICRMWEVCHASRVAHLPLVLGSRVALLLCSKLLRLQLGIGRHALLGIAVGQLEHAVVERVEARKSDKLELVPQLAQVSL